MQFLHAFATFALLAGIATGGFLPQQQSPTQQLPSKAPIAKVKNGSYYGLYQRRFNQDFFLGIPYAQPPVGDLRLRNPQSLNSSWTSVKSATEYSAECFGFGGGELKEGNILSEDCLTLNVIRPHRNSKTDKLPVAVWIHGGGMQQGGTRDPWFNMSFIVEQGVKMNKPFIGVSINYRLHGFGFMWGSAVKAAGVANLGLKDQHLALQWLHENIDAFGGDPKRVTIFGESAGGESVGRQLMAYGGRDDGLFSAAIIESKDVAAPTLSFPKATDFDPTYNNITKAAGCSESNDTLACLRQVPFQELADIFMSLMPNTSLFYTVIDGEFITESGALSMAKGNFVRVPLLHGCNTDEGTYPRYAIPGINTNEQFLAALKAGGRTDEQAKILSVLYPDIPVIGLPATLHERPPVNSKYGCMWKRASAYATDLSMHAGRRYMSQMWTKHGVPVYAYNFNEYVNGGTPELGSTHAVEVAFIFHNLKQEGYEKFMPNPFEGKPASYIRLADLMCRMWISFFVDHTPNHSGLTHLEWPVYTNEDPHILYFDTNKTADLAYVGPDTVRAEGIAYIQSLYD